MLHYLRSKPLFTSILVIILYAVSFVIPAFIKGIPADSSGINGIHGALGLLVPESITAVAVVGIVAMLGWWREVGFVPVKSGAWWYLLPIVILIALLLTLGYATDDTGHWFMGFNSPSQLFAMLFVILLIGLVEETIFRGILLHGLLTKIPPLAAIIISALVFGSFHFVNILAGAAATGTFLQVMHAAAMGFLYGALRLKIGAIWPLMILHGFWDFSLFVLQTISGASNAATDQLDITTGVIISAPAFLYGVFVYWRYSKNESI